MLTLIKLLPLVTCSLWKQETQHIQSLFAFDNLLKKEIKNLTTITKMTCYFDSVNNIRVLRINPNIMLTNQIATKLMTTFLKSCVVSNQPIIK